MESFAVSNFQGSQKNILAQIHLFRKSLKIRWGDFKKIAKQTHFWKRERTQGYEDIKNTHPKKVNPMAHQARAVGHAGRHPPTCLS
jgi:hypothetical protein